MITLRSSCYDSIRLRLPEICDSGLTSEVTQLVAERSHDHGMDVFTQQRSANIVGHTLY